MCDFHKVRTKRTSQDQHLDADNAHTVEIIEPDKVTDEKVLY